MNEIVKSGFLNEIFLPNADLLVDYDFRSPVSGQNYTEFPFGSNSIGYLEYNLQVPTGDQYASSKIVNTGHPAIAYSDNNAVYPHVISGHFNGDTKLKILGNYTGEDWTFYFAFKNLDTTNNASSRVLFSSKDTATSESGFAFGINGCNRLFFEHQVDSSEKRIYTLNKELDNKNVASLSKLDSSLYIGLHQYKSINSFSTEEKFTISGFSPAYSFYLGGMGAANNDYINFSGYIDQFIFIDKGLEFPERNTFAESFYCSGYNESYISTNYSQYASVTGVEYQTTIIGTGITGYEEYLVGNETIGGETVPIYGYSGVTGFLYEDKIVELTGYSTGSSPTSVLLDASGILDYNYILGYANTKILSFNNFEDSYKELYSFSGENNDDVNLTSVYVGANNKFSILATGEGETVNLYVNGLLEPFVASLSSSLTGEFKLSGIYVDSDNFFDRDDIVSYDIVNGILSSETVSESDETNGYKNLSYAAVNNRDIYLNGVKLISGIDFIDTGSQIKVQPSGLVEGQLLLAPKHSIGFTSYTGYNDSAFDSNISLFDEELWINGVKQVKYLDYEKVPDFSMKYTSFSLDPITQTVYNNDTGYFNV